MQVRILSREQKNNNQNPLTMILIDKLSDEALQQIGHLLGYRPALEKHKARRFIKGLNGELKNWEYEETINYGHMHVVLKILEIIKKEGAFFADEPDECDATESDIY